MSSTRSLTHTSFMQSRNRLIVAIHWNIWSLLELKFSSEGRGERSEGRGREVRGGEEVRGGGEK